MGLLLLKFFLHQYEHGKDPWKYKLELDILKIINMLLLVEKKCRWRASELGIFRASFQYTKVNDE